MAPKSTTSDTKFLFFIYQTDEEISANESFRFYLNDQIISLSSTRSTPSEVTNLINKTEQNTLRVISYSTSEAVIEILSVTPLPCLDNPPLFQSKSQILNSLKSDTADAECQIDRVVVSLTCPLSLTRLQTPVKFATCQHAQCLDYTSLLPFITTLLNKNLPLHCPLCADPIDKSNLLLDGLMLDILKSYPQSTSVCINLEDGSCTLLDPFNNKFTVIE